jgi:hypothetical protein
MVCGGHMDRLKGLMSVFLWAVQNSVPFFIEYSHPVDLDLLLEPAGT